MASCSVQMYCWPPVFFAMIQTCTLLSNLLSRASIVFAGHKMDPVVNPINHGHHKNITHVIFDMDGLLLNTEIFYTEVLQDLCRKHGQEFTWEMKQGMMGRKSHEAARFLIDTLGLLITEEEYCRCVREELERFLPTSQLMPGAQKLVAHLHKHGVPMAIATGTHSFRAFLLPWSSVFTVEWRYLGRGMRGKISYCET